MKIIVFGAGGFVGGWVCEVLANDSEHTVIGCIRGWSSAVRLARRGIDIAQVDTSDYARIVEILSQADIVVNASMPSPELEKEVASRLFKASAEAGVSRFIQFSSAAVYGNRTGTISEVVSAEPEDPYGRGKLSMEKNLLTMAKMGGPQLFILRPSIIYGPFSDAWTVRFAKRIASKRWQHLGRMGKGTCNLVYAEDVARSVLVASTVEVPPGSHVFNINGPSAINWNEYIDRFGELLRVNHRTSPAPLQFLLNVVAADFVRRIGSVAKAHFKSLLSRLSRSTGVGRKVVGNAKSFVGLYPTLEELRLLGRKAYYSPAHATRVLNFTATTPLDVGLSKAADWCRAHGIV